MIPKKIHYCWFSGDAFPERVQKCIKSWNHQLPDYELILWDKAKAETIDIPWIQEALRQKKWAFAADAVRLYALYTDGGIYLDSDVEVLKSFDDILNRKYFFCHENGSRRIEAAVMGAEANSPIISKALDFYRSNSFRYEERLVDEWVIPNIMALALQDFEKKTCSAIEVFPEDFFSPKSFTDGKINITGNTYCIHHFASSWRPKELQKSIEQRQLLYKKFPKPIAKILASFLSIRTNLRILGFSGTLKKIRNKI